MVKQTARNNEFMAMVKNAYNNPTFKKITVLVNEGKQELAKYMLDTQLNWYVGGQEAAEKLMEMGYTPKKDDSIETLFGIARGEIVINESVEEVEEVEEITYSNKKSVYHVTMIEFLDEGLTGESERVHELELELLGTWQNIENILEKKAEIMLSKMGINRDFVTLSSYTQLV